MPTDKKTTVLYGTYDGLTSLSPWTDDVPDKIDDKYRQEYKAGYVTGTAMQILLIVSLALAFGPEAIPSEVAP